MSHTIEVMQIRERRGFILGVLRYHSAPMSDKLLESALQAAKFDVSLASIHAELEYLEEKGCVAVHRPKLGLPIDVVSVRLLAHGKDIAMGISTDPGISMGEH